MAQQWYEITEDGVYGQRQWFAGDQIPMEWAVAWGLDGAALAEGEYFSSEQQAALRDLTGTLPWLSGSWHDISDHLAPNSKTTAAVAANLLYATPIMAPRPTEIDALGFGVFTAGAAGTKARTGLYTMDLTTLAPGSLIVAAADELATDATGDMIAAASATLTGGVWYWIAAVFSGTPTVNTYTAHHALMGLSGPVGTATTGITAAHTYGALPETFPTGIGRAASIVRLAARAA